jgi:hypothetical protein
VAIAAAYSLASVAVPTSSTVLYTVPTTTPSYSRDFIITNSGTTTIFVGFGTGCSAAATTNSFQIPAGGTVLLTQCQVPATGIVYGISPTNAGVASFGYGSVVSVT